MPIYSSSRRTRKMDAQKIPESTVPAEKGDSLGNPWNNTPALFMFGDSSGDPSRSAESVKSNPYYIVCAVVLDPLEMIKIDLMMDRIKKKHFEKYDPSSVIFHSRKLQEFIEDYVHDKKQRKKKYSDIFDDLVKLVCGMNIRINIVVLDKQLPSDNYDHRNIEKKSWTMAASIFLRTIKATSSPMIGISVLDKYEQAAIRTVNRAFADNPNLFLLHHKNPNGTVLPRPMFIESKSSNLLQLADMLAHVVMRHYRRGHEENFKQWYDLLNAKFGYVVRLTA